VKLFFIKLNKLIFGIIIVLIILTAILLSIARVVFPTLNKYRPQFENLVSAQLHQPIKIGTLKTNWSGLNPVFTVDDLAVLNEARTVELIKIKQVQIGINLVSSLLHWRLQPNQIKISGTRLVVRQLRDDSLQVNGIVGHFAHSKPASNDIEGFLEWLLNQAEINLNNIDIDFYSKNGMLLPIANLQVKLNKDFFHQRLMGVATLAQIVPNQLRFVIAIHGDIFSQQSLQANFYLRAKNVDLLQWLPTHSWQGVQLTQGMVPEVQLWAHWDNNHWQTVQTLFSAQNITLTSTRFSNPIVVSKFAANALWQTQENGWNLAADHINLVLDQQQWPQNNLSLQVNTKQATQLLRINYLDINDVGQLLTQTNTLNADMQKRWQQLNPQGVITNFNIDHQGSLSDAKQFFISGHIRNLATHALQRIPMIKNLNADFRITQNTGELTVQGEGLLIDFDNLFKHPLIFSHYAGNLTWQKNTDAWQIQAQDVLLATQDASVRADMQLALPNNGSSPYINLLANFYQQGIGQLYQYMPVGIINASLDKWLKSAFLSGTDIQGLALLHGPIRYFPFDDNSGHFEVLAHVNNINLNYKDAWPSLNNLSADVLLDNRSMTITTQSGDIIGMPIGRTQATIADLQKPVLEVQGNVQGDISDGVRFIKNSPLQENLGQHLKKLILSGPMQLALHLHIPLDHPENNKDGTHVAGSINMAANSSLQIPAWHLALDGLSGSLQFTEKSLTAKALQAQFLQKPVTISINTTPLKNNETATQINVTGNVSMAALAQQFKLNIQDYLQGSTAYNAKVILSSANKDIHFNVDSNLQGLAINLPQPLKKSINELAPFHYEMQVIDKENIMQSAFTYNNQVSGALRYEPFKNSWQLKGGEIRFGKQLADYQTAPGLLIDGEIASLNWTELRPYLTTYFARNHNNVGQQTSLPLRKIDIVISKLVDFNFAIQKTKFMAEHAINKWLITIKSANIVGSLIIPANFPAQALQANFPRLYLSPSDNQTSSPLTLNPQEIPPITLTSADFNYGTRKFGQLNLNLTPSSEKLIMDELTISSALLNLHASGEWGGKDKQQYTKIKGNFASKNLGQLLKSWNITKSIVKGNGQGTFDLSWSAPAYAPSMKNLTGYLTIDFAKGRIVHIGKSAETEMGIGRVINLLSLQTIARRLSLDFSDLTHNGFSFDVMRGDFSLEKGNAYTNKFYLNGPVAKLILNGRIGLLANDYDLNLVVTPYITSSLPVIATIAGGPLVGAVTWVASKVLGGTVNKITEHTYKITGSWDNPNVQKVAH
jgi:uncharacterized protein (TIGR02099 family)